MAENAIEVAHISKTYKLGGPASTSLREYVQRMWRMRKAPSKATFKALEDISFTLAEGEVLGIIGKNGAGKSTLLKILSRITTPDSGQVRMKGRVSSLLEVGTGFHPELTGRENIYLNGTILGMRREEIKARFEEIVEFAGVSTFLDTPVKFYSSGMYVRLAFAVAAHLEPEILIIDEVLAVGDAAFQRKCLGKMKEVSTRQGRTVLFVSHNMAAVQSLCTQSLFLSEGKVAGHGPVQDTVRRYLELERPDDAYWQSSSVGDSDVPAKILAVRVCNHQGNTENTIPIDEAFQVEVSFECFRNGVPLHIGLQLHTPEQVAVLATVNWLSSGGDEDPYAEKLYSKGVYTSRCSFRGDFFNEGTYYISPVLMYQVAHVLEKVEQPVAVHIVDTASMKKEYTGAWIGVVRSRFHWFTTEQLPAA